jgi:eukaryotic-like serine/threonine-protein kinase
VVEAARVAAGKLGPEGDVPLLGPEQAAAGAELVSIKKFAVSGSGRPTGETLEAAPVRAEHPLSSWKARRVLVAAVLVLAGVSTWRVGFGPASGTQEIASAEAPDVGTRGLGDSTQPSQVDSQQSLTVAETMAVARELPPQPLPGQQLAPCRVTGQRVINGGCWRRLADISSPCPEDSYEWKGSCYWPVLDRTRPRNSKDPW